MGRGWNKPPGMLGVVVAAISAVRKAKEAQRGSAPDTCMYLFSFEGSQQQQHFTPETQQSQGPESADIQTAE